MLLLLLLPLQDRHDQTALRLIEGNSTVADIMLHDKLQQLAKQSKGQLRLTFTAGVGAFRRLRSPLHAAFVAARRRDSHTWTTPEPFT